MTTPKSTVIETMLQSEAVYTPDDVSGAMAAHLDVGGYEIRGDGSALVWLSTSEAEVINLLGKLSLTAHLGPGGFMLVVEPHLSEPVGWISPTGGTWKLKLWLRLNDKALYECVWIPMGQR